MIRTTIDKIVIGNKNKKYYSSLIKSLSQKKALFDKRPNLKKDFKEKIETKEWH